MRRVLIAAVAIVLCSGFLPPRPARDVPVPESCTPQVNQKLLTLLNSGQRQDVFNVMVCGVTTGPSQTQSGGEHGSHQILPLSIHFSDGSTRKVDVVTNDDLDGVVSAPANAQVFAYGRAYFDNTGPYVAGIDEVHCATNRRADNGWVVVNGTKYPAHC